jgi:hypothetical protein
MLRGDRQRCVCYGVAKTPEQRTAGVPLVTFRYEDSRTGESRTRKVRVVRMDGEKLQGFEVTNSWDGLQEGQFKTFRLGRKMLSAPVLAEFIQ